MTSVISVTRDLIQTSISLIRASDKFGEVSVNTSSLIGALEQTEINRFAEDVPLDFFHQHCARLESVGRGQWDAARSTGLSAFDTLASVVLPQAVRNVLPDLVSNTVEVVKLTSIASVVALPELLYSADMARSLTFNASPIVLAAAIYLVMLWPVVRLISRMERRIAS